MNPKAPHWIEHIAHYRKPVPVAPLAVVSKPANMLALETKVHLWHDMDYMVRALDEHYSRFTPFEKEREAILFAIEQSQTFKAAMAVHLYYPPYGFRLQAIVRDSQVFMIIDYDATNSGDPENEVD